MAQSRLQLSADGVNSELRQLYLEVWPRLVDLFPDNAGFSNPLLLKVKQKYCDAPHRIVVIGQQPNTWYNDVQARSEPDPVRTLMEIYARFDLARAPNTQYWWAAHRVSALLNGAAPSWDFVWTDLLNVGHKRGRVNMAIEVKLCELNILQRELNILQPDVILFFTGPEYEVRLMKTFPDATLIPASAQFDTRWLARVSHESLPAATFRTYHPVFLQRSNRYDLIEAIPSLVKSLAS